MYRTSLQPDTGMLFVFERQTQQTFWMRNTRIPLDMIFIGRDHRVVGVVESATPNTDTPRNVPGASQFVLEVPGGFARERGIGPGTRVRWKNITSELLTHVEQSPARTLVLEPTKPDPVSGKWTLTKAFAGLPLRGKRVAEIKTSMGTLRCELDTARAPNTVANFVGLARGIRPWWDAAAAKWVKRPLYDGTTFHRVIAGFMIQGGDALGDGSGGVGYVIADEVHPDHSHDRAGQLCMANRGPNTNGGQFFITDGASPHLDGGYTIFGQCEPLNVIAEIARSAQSGPPLNRPLTPVVIEAVTIR